MVESESSPTISQPFWLVIGNKSGWKVVTSAEVAGVCDWLEQGCRRGQLQEAESYIQYFSQRNTKAQLGYTPAIIRETVTIFPSFLSLSFGAKGNNAFFLWCSRCDIQHFARTLNCSPSLGAVDISRIISGLFSERSPGRLYSAGDRRVCTRNSSSEWRMQIALKIVNQFGISMDQQW